MRRPGTPRRVMFAVGISAPGRRAEVEDALACAGIDYTAEPRPDGVIAYSVPGSERIRLEAARLIRERA